ncbi:MAG: hypothetical protein AAGA56_08460 [Myxococcota bacterium]
MSSWYFTSAPAKRIAAIRIAVGLFALVYATVRLPHFADYSKLSSAQFRPIGIVKLLLSTPLPSAATWAIALATCVFGAAFVVGKAYRYTGPLFAAGLLWITTYASSWGMIFHTDNLLVLHIVVLAAAPAADVWSWDTRDKAAPDDDARYGWPLRLMGAVAAGAYFLAGVAKLKNEGITWATTNFLRDYVAYDAIRKQQLASFYSPLGGWLTQYSGIWKPLAGISLIVELGFPLAIFHRRLAQLWSVLAMGFHLGVLALMMILFAYPLFGFAFLCFFNVERPAQWIVDRWSKHRPATDEVPATAT